MPQNISSILDRAKVMHSLPSDYKLALVMGISHNSLASYRAGKTLPDARVLVKLCELSGDDPALMLAEIEEQRAKSEEARALWHQIAQRLQSTLHAAVLAVLVSVVGVAGLPMGEAQAHAGNENFSSYTS